MNELQTWLILGGIFGLIVAGCVYFIPRIARYSQKYGVDFNKKS